MTIEQTPKPDAFSSRCEYTYYPSPSGSGILIAAEKDGVRCGHVELQTKGYFGIEAFPDYAIISEHYVFPHRRKQGIGNELLTKAILTATTSQKNIFLKLPDQGEIQTLERDADLKIRIKTPLTEFYEKRGFRYLTTQECQQFVDSCMHFYSRNYLWLTGFNPQTGNFEESRRDDAVPTEFLLDMAQRDVEILYLSRLSDLKDDSAYYRALYGSVEDSKSYMIYDLS